LGKSVSPPQPQDGTAEVQKKCIVSWDDPFQVHSTEVILRWNYQAAKTRMKKLRHCIELTVKAPIKIDGVAEEFVKACIDKALNDEKVRFILEGIIALGVDVLSAGASGGSATASAVTDYVTTVRVKAITCVTDQDKIESTLADSFGQKFAASVRNESHWVYWNL
jgi:hypothetical protein